MRRSTDRILVLHAGTLPRPEIAWVKLESLVEGAWLATRHLWGR